MSSSVPFAYALIWPELSLYLRPVDVDVAATLRAMWLHLRGRDPRCLSKELGQTATRATEKTGPGARETRPVWSPSRSATFKTSAKTPPPPSLSRRVLSARFM